MPEPPRLALPQDQPGHRLPPLERVLDRDGIAGNANHAGKSFQLLALVGGNDL